MAKLYLVNPNGSKAATETMLAIARRHVPDIVGWTNPAGPPMIKDPVALERAASQMAQIVLPEVSGVIVAAFGDPGAEALAHRLTCPVIGIAQAAANAAARDGARFAVATVTAGLSTVIDDLMQRAGGAYLGGFYTQGDPEALLTDESALDAAVLGAVEAAVQAGAERVIIGGGPLALAADRLVETAPVPLIQPLPEACKALLRALN